VGSVVQHGATHPGAPLFLVLDRHWAFGGFHALALGLHPEPTPVQLLQRNSAAPPCVFVLPEVGGQFSLRTDLVAPRRLRADARRHIMNMHARLIPPRDVPSVYESLAF
jgi:hypothetical protein